MTEFRKEDRGGQEHKGIPFILLSGLAANEDIFVPQRLAFPSLMVPAWLIPHHGESLEDYCERMADDLRASDNRISEGQCVIGGASFGGIVAMHLAKWLQPQAVVLIGSIESPEQLPRYVRIARPLRGLVRFIPVTLIQWLLAPVDSAWARHRVPHLSGLARQFRSSDPRLFRRSLQMLLKWRTKPKVDCPVRRIHGEKDRVLPVGEAPVDRLIVGGGHVISLTHGAEVNRFLRSVLPQIETERMD